MDSNSFIQLVELNFPEKYQFRLRKSDNGIQIFCPLRKKWFFNSPEEWVRQHTIQYLKIHYKFPLTNMVAEFPVTINRSNQRADVMVYQDSIPFILCECKEPNVNIDQDVLNQAMRYAQILKTKYIYLTNGLQHVFASIDFEHQKVEILEKLPAYEFPPSAR